MYKFLNKELLNRCTQILTQVALMICNYLLYTKKKKKNEAWYYNTIRNLNTLNSCACAHDKCYWQ